jgi:hypothetical protein
VSEMPDKRNFVHENGRNRSKHAGGNKNAVNPCPMSFLQRGRLATRGPLLSL